MSSAAGTKTHCRCAPSSAQSAEVLSDQQRTFDALSLVYEQRVHWHCGSTFGCGVRCALGLGTVWLAVAPFAGNRPVRRPAGVLRGVSSVRCRALRGQQEVPGWRRHRLLLPQARTWTEHRQLRLRYSPAIELVDLLAAQHQPAIRRAGAGRGPHRRRTPGQRQGLVVLFGRTVHKRREPRRWLDLYLQVCGPAEGLHDHGYVGGAFG